MEDIPQYDPYEDESQNGETFPSLEEKSEVTSKWCRAIFNAEILLSRGDKMASCQVVCQKHDANGSPIDRSILDKCCYGAELPRGDITALAANIIGESMYAQFDVDGN